MKRKILRDEEWMAFLDTEPDRAMEHLVEAYTALICKEASRYLSNPEDVKDCVSDTFLSVYTHRNSYDAAKGSLAAWIGAIARNRAVSLARKANRNREYGAGDGDYLTINPEDETDPVGQAENALDLERAMEELSESDRQMIRMKYFQDMSISEIAKALNIPYETAKKRHTRSLKKLLLLLAVLAAIASLAACGIIEALRYYGVIPGYGAVTEENAVCAMLAEETSEDTGTYHAAVTGATLYNGELDVDFEFWLLGLEAESSWNDPEEYRDAPDMDVSVKLLLPDGTEAEQPFVAAGITWNNYFYGEGKAHAILGDEELKELEENGEYTLTLVLRDVTFGGELYVDSVSLPVSVKTVSVESLDDYPGEYDEETGGMLLDASLEGSTLSLNVYALQGSGWEYSLGLDRDFYSGMIGEADRTPVTIEDENGNLYEGSTPVYATTQIEGASEEAEVTYYDTWNYYLSTGAGYSTYLFEGISPGKYTLKLPYIYLLAFGDYGTLKWNLEDCSFSEEAINIPGGKMYTTSICRIDCWGEETTDAIMDYFWEIRVKCDLDREDMTVTGCTYAGDSPYPWVDNLKLAYRLKEWSGQMDSAEWMYNATFGRLDEETGELVFRFACNESFYQSHDFSDLEYNPVMERQKPLVYRYDHEVEIEFEVAE